MHVCVFLKVLYLFGGVFCGDQQAAVGERGKEVPFY